jgi:hypothetical protein
MLLSPDVVIAQRNPYSLARMGIQRTTAEFAAISVRANSVAHFVAALQLAEIECAVKAVRVFHDCRSSAVSFTID